MAAHKKIEGADDEMRGHVLTEPVSLEAASGAEKNASGLVKRVFGIFKEIRLVSDLAQLQLQLPVAVNIPKSQLQVYGEPAYAFKGVNLLQRCNQADTPLRRFIAVVAWTISTTRPIIFGFAPFNPILGETHHVSRGTLNVLLEQVSHHPPVSALHATDERERIDLTWTIFPVVKFHGARVEADIIGKRQLRLLNHGETYLMNSPKFLCRFVPPGVDWIGNVKISCPETGFVAELCYSTSSFLGRGDKHRVKGKIYGASPSSSSVLYELDGHWDSVVRMEDLKNGSEQIIYNAKDIISELKSPVINNPQGLWPSESAIVWSEVSKGIINKNWNKAREAKKAVEDKQREVAKERKSRGENWVPKHFTLSFEKGNGYDCNPIHQHVQPAPIVFSD